MRVESDIPHLERHLHSIARILTDNDGFVADDFIVRQRGGEFSCAITEQPGVADRVLVSYAPELTVPLWKLRWSDDPDVMLPVDGLESLTPPQRALLEEWLPLVNDTAKLSHIRAVVPKFAVTSWPLRHHLAGAGYLALRTPPVDLDPKHTLSGWHSTGGGRVTMADDNGAPEDDAARVNGRGSNATARPRWRLIPLKHLVNHDPGGAPQVGVQGQTSVVTSAASDHIETFENYGDLDALQLLMGFGYVATNAPVVHSVPSVVEAPGFGRVQVKWQAPRYRNDSLPAAAAEAPAITPTEDGFSLHHLSMRPHNRPVVARLLGMAAQSRSRLSAETAARNAEHLLDLISEANLEYYRHLDDLVAKQFKPAAEHASSARANGIFTMLAQVSLQQQQLLRNFWS